MPSLSPRWGWWWKEQMENLGGTSYWFPTKERLFLSVFFLGRVLYFWEIPLIYNPHLLLKIQWNPMVWSQTDTTDLAKEKQKTGRSVIWIWGIRCRFFPAGSEIPQDLLIGHGMTYDRMNGLKLMRDAWTAWISYSQRFTMENIRNMAWQISYLHIVWFSLHRSIPLCSQFWLLVVPCSQDYCVVTVKFQHEIIMEMSSEPPPLSYIRYNWYDIEIMPDIS